MLKLRSGIQKRLCSLLAKAKAGHKRLSPPPCGHQQQHHSVTRTSRRNSSQHLGGATGDRRWSRCSATLASLQAVNNERATRPDLFCPFHSSGDPVPYRSSAGHHQSPAIQFVEIDCYDRTDGSVSSSSTSTNRTLSGVHRHSDKHAIGKTRKRNVRSKS